MKRNRLIIIGGVVLIFGLTIVLGLVASRLGGGGANEAEQITIQKDGGELTVKRNGSVSYKFGGEVFTDQWGQGKTDTFFKHFEGEYLASSGQVVSGGQNYITLSVNGQNQTYLLDNNDELVDVVVDDTTNGGGGDEGGGGTDNPPQPTPPPGNQGGGDTDPTPTPAGIFSNCLYWRLSYCVIPKTPTPTPQGTPDPDANVIQAANCGEYLNGNLVPTIISNTLCLPSPTPSPTP